MSDTNKKTPTLSQEDFEALFGNQSKLLNQIDAQRRPQKTVGGDRVDPNAPTGLAWIEAFGPNSTNPDRQASLAARQAAVNADGGPASVREANGRAAVANLKAQQYADGTRGPQDENGANNYANQVVKTPGSNVRVAYDANGQPVGFSGASMPERATSVAAKSGGFSPAEQQSFRNTALQLAGNQSTMDAFGGPPTDAPPSEADTNVPPPPSSNQGRPGTNPDGSPKSWGDRANTAIQGFKDHGVLDSLQAGIKTAMSQGPKLYQAGADRVGEGMGTILNDLGAASVYNAVADLGVDPQQGFQNLGSGLYDINQALFGSGPADYSAINPQKMAGAMPGLVKQGAFKHQPSENGLVGGAWDALVQGAKDAPADIKATYEYLKSLFR